MQNIQTTQQRKVIAANNGGDKTSLSLLSALLKGLGVGCLNSLAHFLTSQPAANSGGGFTTICGVDINSPFVHASEMALPPVLPADEPFANEKNIDKAKEWLRKEG